MKRIVLKNISNMRDLGGYFTIYNREIKYNQIIRSSLINKLEKDEINYFIKRNICTIIDLREKDEINNKKNALSQDKRFRYYNIPLQGRNFPKLEKDIADGYINIINDKESIYKVFRIILDTTSGVIFCCNSGKDRTGMIAMLLLLICGVNKEDIIADYSVSYIYLKEMIDIFHRENPQIPKFVGTSKSKYMEKTLELFYKKYNSIEKYMEYIGFSNKELVCLRNKLLKEEDSI